MGRVREFNPEQALSQAMELFWEKGYDQTSMEDLVKLTGVSRYGFYSTFGDKRDLYDAVFQRYREMVIQQRFGLLLSPDASMPEVVAVFRGLRESVVEGDTRGCLICNTAAQLAPNDSHFRELTQSVFDQVGSLFERAFSNAVKKGQLPDDFKIGEAANLIAGTVFLVPFMIHAGFGLDRVFGYMTAIESQFDPG